MSEYKFKPNAKKRQPSPEQQAKSEARRAKLTEVWSTIAAMSDEEREKLIQQMPIITTCEGHALSGKNTLLLAAQLETVTVVGGYKQWQKYGRQVRKGESALGLWIPKTKDQKEGEANPQEKGQTYFFFGSVFDVTQTDPITEAANE